MVQQNEITFNAGNIHSETYLQKSRRKFQNLIFSLKINFYKTNIPEKVIRLWGGTGGIFADKELFQDNWFAN